MRKIHWLVLGAAAALLVNAGSAAAAPPNFTAAAKLCTAQGGGFGLWADQLGSGYECERLGNLFSDAEFQAARGICEGAYKGEFQELNAPGAVPLGHYECRTVSTASG